MANEQIEKLNGNFQLQQNTTFASKNNSMGPIDDQLLPPQDIQVQNQIYESMPHTTQHPQLQAQFNGSIMSQQQTAGDQSNNAGQHSQSVFYQKVSIDFEELQLFDRLKKIIDCTVKVECVGCHKLIPTVQFYDHLMDSAQGAAQTCEDEAEYQ